MNRFPLVSIITPVYNTGKLLLETYDCLEQQSYNNIEWILIDDSSTDEITKEVLDDIQERSSFKTIVLRNETNRKQSFSKNRGFLASSGAYVRFLDADDLLGDSLLIDQVEYLLAHECDVVAAPTINFTWSEGAIGRIWSNDLYKRMGEVVDLPSIFLVTPLFHHCSCLIPRSVFEASSGFREDLYTDEDGWFLLSLMLKGTTFSMIETSGYWYRHHGETDRVSSNSTERKWKDRYKVCQLFEAKARNLGVLDNYRIPLAQRIDLIASKYYRHNKSAALNMIRKACNLAPSYRPVQGSIYYWTRRILGFVVAEQLLHIYSQVKLALARDRKIEI